MIEFFVPGIPRPQGSKRAFPTKTGRVVMVESSPGVKDWRADIKVFAVEAMRGRTILDGPVVIRCDFVMKRPATTPKTKTPPAIRRPDLDKLARSVFDSLTSVIWTDDSRVVDLTATKRIAEPGEQPGVRIFVREAEQ